MRFPVPLTQSTVHRYTEPVTVKRRDDTTSSNYGEDLTYTELPETRDVFVMELDESETPGPAGEMQTRQMVALALPDEDLQENDRLKHGGKWYEITDSVKLPNASMTAAIRYRLDNR